MTDGPRTLVVGGDLALAVELARGLSVHGHQLAIACDSDRLVECEQEISRRWPESASARPILCAIGQNRAAANELDVIRTQWTKVDLLVVAPASACAIEDVIAHERTTLQDALDGGAWPLIGSIHAVGRVFSESPRYAVAISHDDSLRFAADGAYRSVTTGVLETFTRYMATHLRPDGVLVNALRLPAGVARAEGDTASQTDWVVAAANVLVAIASGLLDAMSGQVLTVDGGAGLRAGVGVAEVR